MVKLVTAGASVATAAALPMLIPRALQTLRAAKHGERNRQELRTAYATLELRNAELREANEALEAEVQERRRAEQEARGLAAIVESSDDAIFGRDLEMRVTSWNAGAERLFGFTAAEVLGARLWDLVPPDQAGETQAYRDRVKEGERIRAFETERFTKSGRRVSVSLTLSPLFDEDERVVGVATIARDITEQKQLAEQLRQSQRLQAVGQLAGGVAHDFNNLLTVIRGNAAFLQADLPEDDPRRPDVGEVIQAADRAAELTRQLLAFSRRQILEPRDLELNEVVLSTDRLLRRLIGKDVEVVTLLDPGGAPARVDPGQMEQVLLNLALNARDAMPDGGRLTISTAAVDVGPGHPDAPVVRPGPYSVIEVSDTGVGMTEEVREQVFEPYFTTKPRGKGTGLGLSMVHGIVQQSGGHIVVDSEPGGGARFRVFFPRLPQAAAPHSPDPAAPADRARGGTETVLLVEDEDAVRLLARRTLVRAGYTVAEARNGQEGLRVWTECTGAIDLVVADLEMPLMGGREMVHEILRQRPGVKILYISGYTEESAMRGGERENGSAFVAKPFSPEALAAAVRRQLDARNP
jgi:PAS domain S-box-containing protein